MEFKAQNKLKKTSKKYSEMKQSFDFQSLKRTCV